MLGWLIILGVSIVLVVLSIIALFNDWFCLEETFVASGMLFGVVAFVALLVIIICSLEVPREIKSFKNYDEIIAIAYNNEDENFKTAMNLKVIEMNQWLADARASEETYGIFSFYHNKLDDLEYIKIGDE